MTSVRPLIELSALLSSNELGLELALASNIEQSGVIDYLEIDEDATRSWIDDLATALTQFLCEVTTHGLSKAKMIPEIDVITQFLEELTANARVNAKKNGDVLALLMLTLLRQAIDFEAGRYSKMQDQFLIAITISSLDNVVERQRVVELIVIAETMIEK